MFRELVVQRLRVHDVRFHLAYEVVDEGGQWPPTAEHQAYSVVRTFAGMHRQYPAAQLTAQSADELTQRRLPDYTQRVSATLGNLSRELGDLFGNRVDTRGRRQHRGCTVTESGQSHVERRVVVKNGEWNH